MKRISVIVNFTATVSDEVADLIENGSDELSIELDTKQISMYRKTKNGSSQQNAGFTSHNTEHMQVMD